MNAPSKQTQLIAFPPVALVIMLLCGLFIWNWFQGNAPWYVAVIALALASHTMTKVAEVRRYKDWKTAWNAMGAPASPPAKSSKVFNVVFGVFIVGLILFTSNRPWMEANGPAIAALIVIAAVVLGIPMLIWKLWRKTKVKTKGAATSVTWMIQPASSSPSRADAMKALPEYSARLLSPR